MDAYSKRALATWVAASMLSLWTSPARAGSEPQYDNVDMRISAGTVFNLAPVFDTNGAPVFPWPHEVRGVVQVSNLGNCTVLFKVQIDAGTVCQGGHANCLAGTMTITTLAGDELQTHVTGWGDPDPNDPARPQNMNSLHYDVTITGGTGKLDGAKGQGVINGVFNFCGQNCFCESYAGVATWVFEGVLQLPKPVTLPSHRISAISYRSGEVASLALGGATPPAALQKYFDLYPLEASEDLKVWEPIATIVRTNVTNEIVYVDADMAAHRMRFYRTPTNQFSTPFLAPTGPFAVGTLERTLADPTRTNRYRVKTNSSFVVTFWYPARPSAGKDFAPYMDRLLAERKAYWGAFTNRVPALVSHSWRDVPFTESAEPFPVVIYSHGLGDQQGHAVRTENTEKVQELASHGYVVLAIDHTDAYGVVLPPDHLIAGGNAWSFDFLKDRLVDVKFLLGYLEQINASDEVFKGRLDLNRIGMMGWSFGGGTTAEACRTEEKIKAAVLLDAFLDAGWAVLKNGLAKPVISMNSGALISENTTLFNKSTSEAYLLSIRGADHDGFTDTYWITAPSAAARARSRAMNACMVSFFNKYLKGADDQLLQNPAMAYPEVVSFRKK